MSGSLSESYPESISRDKAGDKAESYLKIKNKK